MTNLEILETLRTKEEILNYFKQMGGTITEEQIEDLKKSYKQIELNNSSLSLQQLNYVAGGIELNSPNEQNRARNNNLAQNRREHQIPGTTFNEEILRRIALYLHQLTNGHGQPMTPEATAQALADARLPQRNQQQQRQQLNPNQ